jgi:hypothetical protein
MTEDEWLRSTDPEPMFKFLTTIRARSQPGFLRSLFRGWVTETSGCKQDRLFICACHRRLWEFLNEAERDFVATYEYYALGLTDEDSVTKRWQAIWSDEQNEVIEALTRPVLGGVNMPYPDPWWQAEENDPASWALDLRSRLDEDAIVGESAAQAFLLRDIFGNPCQPVAFNPAWRTSTVAKLAAAIYEDCQLPSGLFDTQRLGVLADALEDAGCDSADILGHLRGSGEHVRGCWAIDLVVGKE